MRFCLPFPPCLGSALGYLPTVIEATQKYCRPLLGYSVIVILPQLLPKATGQQLLYEGVLFTRSWCTVKKDTWQPPRSPWEQKSTTPLAALQLFTPDTNGRTKNCSCLPCPLKSHRHIYPEASFCFCIFKRAELAPNTSKTKQNPNQST